MAKAKSAGNGEVRKTKSSPSHPPSEKRRGTRDLESFQSQLTQLKNYHARLAALVKTMEVDKIRRLDLDGATQFDRAFSILNRYASNVEQALVRLKW